MKSLVTLLLGFSLGVMTVLFWPRETDSRETVAIDTSASKKHTNVGISSLPVDEPSAQPHDNHQAIERESASSIRDEDLELSLEMELAKPIDADDLESWLESKKGDSQSYGEALAIAGLLMDDADLVRHGIETDSENEYLLYVGATLSGFSQEERAAMSQRLVAADPENVLAAYISTAYLLQAGEVDAAIELLKSSSDRHRMDDFRSVTQLMKEEALIAAGLSPEAATFQSTFDLKMEYLSDLRDTANSLKNAESSLSPDEVSEIRFLTATMGQRLADQSRSGYVVEHLAGLAVEEATLSGLADEAPSPYAGLTVSQAMASIANERQEVKQVLESFIDIQDYVSSRPNLVSGYIDRFRLVGELEAQKWLQSAIDSER